MTKPKILIVEDHEKVANALGKACEAEAMEPIVVYNGKNALATFAEQEDIALIVLDIGLPDICGYDLCRKIRETSKIPIIFMTARLDEVDEVAGLAIGGTGYIKKPVRSRIVAAHVQAVLRQVYDWGTPGDEVKKESKPKLHPDFILDNESKVITFKGQELDLSSAEFTILS